MNDASLAHLRLRSATAAAHSAVDTAFGRFDLRDRQAYAGFLRAHARCVPSIEGKLDHVAPAGWRARSPALLADLEGLDCPAPSLIDSPDLRTAAAAWGALYVLEGSRLGGALLKRRVSENLPTGYLSQVHAPGAWRSFQAVLDAALTTPAAQEEAIDAACRVFAMFRRAVELEGAERANEPMLAGGGA